MFFADLVSAKAVIFSFLHFCFSHDALHFFGELQLFDHQLEDFDLVGGAGTASLVAVLVAAVVEGPVAEAAHVHLDGGVGDVEDGDEIRNLTENKRIMKM